MKEFKPQLQQKETQRGQRKRNTLRPIKAGKERGRPEHTIHTNGKITAHQQATNENRNSVTLPTPARVLDEKSRQNTTHHAKGNKTPSQTNIRRAETRKIPNNNRTNCIVQSQTLSGHRSTPKYSDKTWLRQESYKHH